jgi:molybdenum cofactor guanylyltransferase
VTNMDRSTSMRVGAIVLCGGQSKRMGQPKAWLPFGNELLLQRVVRRLSPVASPIVVVRAPGQTLPELPAQTLIIEDAVEHRGPLQGIAHGLAALRNTVETAFVSSTDAPFVDPALVTRLCELRGPAHDLVVPYAHGRHHPLAALYTLNVLFEVERMLAENQRRLMDVLGRVRTLVVGEEELVKLDPRLRFLTNINTLEDYRAALAEEGHA